MGGRNGVGGREAQYNAEISCRVEELRKERKVGPSELAKAAGVTPQMLRNYVVGLTRWPVFRVRLIADYFGVKVERLLPRSKSYMKPSCIQEELPLG